MFHVIRIMPDANGNLHRIASCAGHIQATMDELGVTKIVLETVDPDPDKNTCMGCLKGW